MQRTLFVLALAVLSGMEHRGPGPIGPSLAEDADQGTFLLLSDIHFDPYADTTLVPKLAEAPVDQWTSIFESSSLKAFSIYGKDTDYPLLASTMEETAEPDFPTITSLSTATIFPTNSRTNSTSTWLGTPKLTKRSC